MADEILEKIKSIVEKEENCTDVGHNMEHTMRVYNTCLAKPRYSIIKI